MQIATMNNIKRIENRQNFKGGFVDNVDEKKNKQITIEKDAQSNNSYLDKKNDSNLGFFTKLLNHPSLIIIPLLPSSCYDTYSIYKNILLKKQIKNSLIEEEKLKEFKNKSKKFEIGLFLTAIPLYFITDYINKKNKNKNLKKAKEQVEKFNIQNQTNINLTNKSSKSKSILTAGSFNGVTGELFLPDKIPGDIIMGNIMQKYIIKHELIHAQQYMLMAKSKDGIERLNYIVAKRTSESFDEQTKKDICDNYLNILNATNNYDKPIKINNYEVPAKNLIIATYNIIKEKEKNPKNIPIIINKNFYEKAIMPKSPLTQEEELKALKYFDAIEKYPKKVSFLQSINPFSDYNQNLLEKEASKAAPWYAYLFMFI